MKIFGSITELATLVFRKIGQGQLTVRPNQTVTYTGDRDVQLPQQDADSVLVSRTSTDTLTNKTLGSTNTLTGATAGSFTNTGTVTLFTSSDTVVGRNTTDTLTNKTLTSPAINSPTGLVKADVGLSNVDNTSDATKNAAVATLTNKTLTSPVINTPTGIVKGDVGLGNVDNTSDTTKNAASVVLTNKDIDGGTASNTSRITLPKASTATISGLTRKQGTIAFDTTLGTPVFDNGTTVSPLASTATATPTAQGITTSYFPVIASGIKTVSSADYTVLTTDGFVEINVTTGASDRAITLPAAASNTGRMLTVQKADNGAGRVNVTPAGSDTINGGTNKALTSQYDAITLICNGTIWNVIGYNIGNYIVQAKNTAGTITTSTNNLTSISVPPGTWLLTALITSNGGANEGIIASISTVTGTHATNDGSNRTKGPGPLGVTSMVIPNYLVTITSTTVFYLVCNSIVSQTSVVDHNFQAIRLAF